MSKENVVEIKGHRYRYTYQDGKTIYIGPVGTAPPLSEEEFLRALSDFKKNLVKSYLSGNRGWNTDRNIFQNLVAAGVSEERIQEWLRADPGESGIEVFLSTGEHRVPTPRTGGRIERVRFNFEEFHPPIIHIEDDVVSIYTIHRDGPTRGELEINYPYRGDGPNYLDIKINAPRVAFEFLTRD